MSPLGLHSGVFHLGKSGVKPALYELARLFKVAGLWRRGLVNARKKCSHPPGG
jgi:hypothetical protein